MNVKSMFGGMMRGLFGLRVLGMLLALTPGSVFAEWNLNFTPASTLLGKEIQAVHGLVMWIIVGISIFVFGAMFWSILKHRKSVGHKASNFHENTTIEIIWTVIPVIILIAMSFPATRLLLATRDSSASDITIKATGYQWRWGYEYLDEGVKFYSTLATPRSQINGVTEKGRTYLLEVDNPVVVPVGKKIRILTTANDVIHSWAVPGLAVKQDAIPGFIRDIAFKAETVGIYRGQCSELCGKEHGFMPIVVEVVTEEDYQAWIQTKLNVAGAPSFDSDKSYLVAELVATGEQVYNANCVACHQVGGVGMAPTFPAIKGGKIATGSLEGHLDIILNGSAKNPMMAAWGPILSDMDVAAVIAYQRNGINSTGDFLQPADIAAARSE
ncbi:MAG: cytochrome c oxidase subunit II [Proteobacteria bacterium]|nr:cytochrome c oxidase subunit II [Pseudomonadota bacterium]